MLIGCHTDNLKDKSMLARWPLIKRVLPLTDRLMTVKWMFGGLVAVKAPKGRGSHLKVILFTAK